MKSRYIKILFILLSLLTLFSIVACEKVEVPDVGNENENNNNNNNKNEDTSEENDSVVFTICNPVRDTTDITHLVVKILQADGNSVFEQTQWSESFQFKDITCTLPKGVYSLVAVSHAGNSKYGFITIHTPDSASLPSAKIYNTFCGKKQITITDNMQPISITLYHATALLSIQSTTRQPDEVKALRIIVGDNSNTNDVIDYVCFSPSKKGLRTSPGSYYDITMSGRSFESKVAYEHPTYDNHFMLRETSETVPIKAEVLDVDYNILSTHDFGNVKLEKGKTRTLKVDLFGNLQ